MGNQYINMSPGASPIPTAPDGYGVFEPAIQGGALHGLAIALPKDNGRIVTNRADLSIPTPWSSVISFDILLNAVASTERAGTDEKALAQVIQYGPIQDRTETEWRVLVTLLALRRQRNIPLKLEPVNLETDQFSRQVARMLPEKSAFPSGHEAWKHLCLLRLEGDVIGMLTPSSLVCSRYCYDGSGTKQDVQPKALEWLHENELSDENYTLKDPNIFIKQDPESEYVLWAWLDQLRCTMGDAAFGGEQRIADNLSTLVDRFLTSLLGEQRYQTNPRAPLPMHCALEQSKIQTAPDLVYSLRSIHTTRALLTVMAFNALKEYSITISPVKKGSPFSDLFHNSYFDTGNVADVMVLTEADGLTQHCLGMLDQEHLLRAADIPNLSSTALSELGILNDLGQYKDPIQVIKLHPFQHAYLLNWLDAAMKLVGGRKEWESLRKDLEDFSTALQSTDTAVTQYKKLIRVAIGNNEGIVLSALVTDVRVDVDLSNPQMLSPFTWGKSSWVILKQLPDYDPELEKIYRLHHSPNDPIGFQLPENAQVLDVDAIFTSGIYYVARSADAIGPFYKQFSDDTWGITTADGNKHTVLWPIRDDAPPGFSPGDILDKLSYAYDDDTESCMVSLTLPGENTLYKSYPGPASNNIIAAADLPGLSVWPYVRDFNWYTAYFSQNPGSSFSLELQQGNNPVEISISEWDRLNPKTVIRKIWYFNTLPDCARVVAHAGAARQSRGWLRLPQPTVVMPTPQDNMIMNVGLDFGTSSSAVFVELVSGDVGKGSKHVDFGETPTGTLLPHLTASDADLFFLPDVYPDQKFHPSILRESSTNTTLERMMERGNIPYLDDADSVNSGAKSRWDLKWIDPENVQQAYLMQLVTQVMVHAKLQRASKTKWFASYPATFSTWKIGRYQASLDQILQICSDALNINSTQVNLMTESFAAARFHTQNIDIPGLMIVVDIGGGSTDICMLDSRNFKVLAESSFKIASREIFLKPLKELLSQSDSPEIVNLRNTISRMKVNGRRPCALLGRNPFPSDEAPRLIEQALRDANMTAALQSGIARLASKDNHSFLQKVVSGIFAVFYFMLETLKDQLKETTGDVNIILVGNGARIFDDAWIQRGFKDAIESYVKKYIKECRCDPHLQVNITSVDNDTAKTEAANGLLIAQGVGLESVPATVLSGFEVVMSYTLNNENNSSTIPGDGYFYNADDRAGIINLLMDPSNNARVTDCGIGTQDLAKRIKPFVDALRSEIFNGLMLVNPTRRPDWKKITMETKQKIIKTINEDKLILSPLFTAMVETIRYLCQ